MLHASPFERPAALKCRIEKRVLLECAWGSDGKSMSGIMKPISLWEPLEGDWPDSYETVDLFWAKLALEWGHARTLARYLRETADVDPLVLRAMHKMLDPGRPPLRPQRWRLKFKWLGRGRPTAPRPTWPISASNLADLLEPEGSRHKWRLIFERPSAGNPGDWRQYWRQQALAMDIRFTRRQMPGKPSWAVEHFFERGVAKPRKVSRATAYRALAVRSKR